MEVTPELLTLGGFHQDTYADTTWYCDGLPGWVCLQQNTPRFRMSGVGDVIYLTTVHQLFGLFLLMNVRLPEGWLHLKKLPCYGCRCEMCDDARGEQNGNQWHEGHETAVNAWGGLCVICAGEMPEGSTNDWCSVTCRQMHIDGSKS